jgi:hypothetical protein
MFSIFQVLASIGSKSPTDQDEYLSAADMTFTTISPLGDLLDLCRSGSSWFAEAQSRCLGETIQRLRHGGHCADAEAELQAPVMPFKDLPSASAVQVTHENLNQYAASVTETLCWNNCAVALAAMRDGYCHTRFFSFLRILDPFRFEACMPTTELRHLHVEDVRAALFVRVHHSQLSCRLLYHRFSLQVPAIDVCEWRRRTVHHGAKVTGSCTPRQASITVCHSNPAVGTEKPQVGWFWNYVEQCSQAEKAEVATEQFVDFVSPQRFASHTDARCATSCCRGGPACCPCPAALRASKPCTSQYQDLTHRERLPSSQFISFLGHHHTIAVFI